MPEGRPHRFVDDLLRHAHLPGGVLTGIDGLRVDYPDGWGLVRASNTTPALVLRFEGDVPKRSRCPASRPSSPAADMPEVSAEFTDQEEGAMVNYGFYGRNVIAREKALYKGHVVAAVAANDPSVAEQALDLIEVDYEILPPVLNAEDAMKDDAPILHERLLTMHSPTFRSGGWGDADTQTNVANRFEFQIGDAQAGFEQADVIVEREFRTESVHQGYIEPHAATSHWDSDGYVTVWCSTQGHFGVRDHTSAILGLPVSRVKIIPMEIGGGFGGKGQSGVYLEPLAAKLSQKSGQPVKIVMSRYEVFVGTGPYLGDDYECQNGSDARRQDSRRRSPSHLRSGRVPRLPSRLRLQNYVRPPTTSPTRWWKALTCL